MPSQFGGAIFGAEWFGQGGVLDTEPEAPAFTYCLVSAIVRLSPTLTATRADPTLSASALTSPLVATARPALVTATKLLLPDP